MLAELIALNRTHAESLWRLYFDRLLQRNRTELNIPNLFYGLQCLSETAPVGLF